MKLNLTRVQIGKAFKGQTIQIKASQIGSGMSFDLHPSNLKKLQKAHRLNKGVRMTFSRDELDNFVGGELEDMQGGSLLGKVGKLAKSNAKKAVNRGVNLGSQWAKKNITEDNIKKYAIQGYKQYNDLQGGSFFGSIGKSIKKAANKTVNKASDWGKKNLTQKNVAKVSLKAYNNLNKNLEKTTGNSLHGMILDNVVGAVPFVPQTAKDVAANYANRAIDKQLSKESKRIGAGLYSQARPNPYLPRGLMSGSGVMVGSGGKKVYNDSSNLLRPDQAGFKGLSAQQAEKLTGRGFLKYRGGSFLALGE